VSWFSDRFRKEPEHVITNIPLSTVLRWALYDFGIDNPNEIASKLGLTPVSKEGEEKEQEDSLIRMGHLEEVLPFIDVISELNARIVASVQMRELKEEGISGLEEIGEEELDHMVGFYQAISFSALVAAISCGIQLDILHVHAVGTARTFDEEEL
jgi:hypothetical protein